MEPDPVTTPPPDRPAITAELRRVLFARAVRGFADGLVSIVLVRYLTAIGYSPFRVGAVVTATLLGSALLTIGVGVSRIRLPRSVLIAAAGLMFLTGIGFATVTAFALVLAVAIVGTVNPSAGDVSVFLPTEQAFIADRVDAPARPAVYARYNLAGGFAAAAGALATAVPGPLGDVVGVSEKTMLRLGFLVYAAAAVVAFMLYRGLGTEPVAGVPRRQARQPLRSRRTLIRLIALFSLDSAAGGFVVQSLVVLWLHLRFGLSAPVIGATFLATSLLGALSQLLAGRVAARLGLVRAMVFTHLPASLLLALAGLAPTAATAVGLLVVRSLFAQMDVPARQAFVMAVVPPEERTAAASLTNVPRSLAGAATQLLAGLLLTRSHAGWPLVIGGLGKVTYDLLLLRMFRDRD
jgi:MFS family permease